MMMMVPSYKGRQERETERQRDRETERQRDREAERQRGREAETRAETLNPKSLSPLHTSVGAG